MGRHLQQVASGFQTAGWVLGIPALLLFVFAAGGWLTMQLAAPPSSSSDDSGPTSIVSLLVGFAKILGKIFSLFAAAAQIVIFWVAVVSLVLLLIAALMLFTGRGLEAQAGWARATGMLIGTLFFLISLLAVLSFRPGVMSGFFLTTGGMSGYVLWTLWFRFF